jgi:hypothetical protein
VACVLTMAGVAARTVGRMVRRQRNATLGCFAFAFLQVLTVLPLVVWMAVGCAHHFSKVEPQRMRDFSPALALISARLNAASRHIYLLLGRVPDALLGKLGFGQLK